MHQLSPRRPAPPETTAAEVCLPDDLLLWLLRRQGEQDGAHRAIRVNLRHLLGPVQGEHAAAAFAGFYAFLSRHARRPLRLDVTAADRASADERAILGLVAACAGEAAGGELALARARWLVPEEMTVELRTRARGLAAALDGVA